MRAALPFAVALAAGALAFAAAPAPEAPLYKVDVHTHLHPRAVGDALHLARAAGVVGLVNLSGGPAERGLETQLKAAARTGGAVVVSTSPDWRGFGSPGWAEREVTRLEAARALGARGLKIEKHLGVGLRDPDGALVAPDDPRLDPLFEAAGRLGLVVSMHTGDPKAFFEPLTPDNERYEELSLNPGWSFHGPGQPSWEGLLDAFERRVARHPQTSFIGVHFGNAPEDPARVGRMLSRLPNLYVDTAARVGEMGREDVPGRRDAVRRLILEHRRRVLFGTDLMVMPGRVVLGAPEAERRTPADAVRWLDAQFTFFETGARGLPNPTPIQGRWTVAGLDLPRDVLHDVYHRNAERLFGAPWRPLP